MPEPVLLYISFGPGPHVDEVIFSAYSAALKRRPADRFRVAIFTNDAKQFQSTPAEIVAFDKYTTHDWMGPSGFIHRRKLMAMKEALRRFQAAVVMIDGDTYFRQSPQKLFDRINPVRSVMHVAEGPIGHLSALGHKRHELARLHLRPRPGDDWELDPDWIMWNSGVVGLDPSNAGLVDRALALSDALTESSGHINSEQIAFTRILEQHTTLQPSRDVVFHYHEWFVRDPFRKQLHGLLAGSDALSADQRASWLYAHRPFPPLEKKLKAMIKRPLKRLGMFKYDLNTST